MPYVSEKQRKFLWANHPEVAKRWEREGKGYVTKKGKKIVKKKKSK